jgi:hypothetical protein
MYEALKVVIANDAEMAYDFIKIIGNESNLCEYLPPGQIENIHGLNNLKFIFLHDCDKREDIMDILKYAHKNDFEVFYFEYGQMMCINLH